MVYLYSEVDIKLYLLFLNCDLKWLLFNIKVIKVNNYNIEKIKVNVNILCYLM